MNIYKLATLSFLMLLAPYGYAANTPLSQDQAEIITDRKLNQPMTTSAMRIAIGKP